MGLDEITEDDDIWGKQINTGLVGHEPAPPPYDPRTGDPPVARQTASAEKRPHTPPVDIAQKRQKTSDDRKRIAQDEHTETPATQQPNMSMLLQIVTLGLKTLAENGVYIQPPAPPAPLACTGPEAGAWPGTPRENGPAVAAPHIGSVYPTLTITEPLGQTGSEEGEYMQRYLPQQRPHPYDARSGRPDSDWKLPETTWTELTPGTLTNSRNYGQGLRTPCRVSEEPTTHSETPTQEQDGERAVRDDDVVRRARELEHIFYITPGLTADGGKTKPYDTGMLHVTREPARGFPRVHTAGPWDHLRHIPPTRIKAFDKLPANTACMVDVFGPGDVDNEQLNTIGQQLRNAVVLITGDEGVEVEKPDIPIQGAKWNAPTVWILKNLRPSSHATLRNRTTWDNALAPFRIIERDPIVPMFLFAATSLRTKDELEIEAAMKAIMLTGDILRETCRVIANDETTQFASPMEGVRAVVNSVRVSVKDMGGDMYRSINGPVARIYCRPPTLHGNDWEEWRKTILKTTLPFATGKPRTGCRCKTCHGVDHTTHLCMYDKKNIVGWIGAEARGSRRKKNARGQD
ncbi:hypothetical protein C2E23DRAFT_884734 [Lenzites betulinus]|nr:hypothetical protein C2E23DRAFT_884734 [Lenzites betulinus]